MLGQLSFEVPTGKLRDRVALSLAKTADVRSVMCHCHYLGRPRVGAQLNYLVTIDGRIDGAITFAYPMMSARICGVPSDEVLEFARLYLDSNIPHTASAAIGQSLRRVKADWERTFPNAKPVQLVVSWSDTTRHLGTIYKAANFVWLRRCHGQPPGNAATSKRGKREQHGDYSHDKDCWVYPLTKAMRRRLREEALHGAQT